MWLRKSETTLDGDDKLLPMWQGPFQVTARLGENRSRLRVFVNREIEVTSDRLKPEVPSLKNMVKPLYWTFTSFADQAIEGGKYDLERVLEARHNEQGDWEFLCKMKGFDSSHNNWEPAHSSGLGYTRAFITFLKKNPHIGVLLTDCLTKPDRQIASEGARPQVNSEPAFFGPPWAPSKPSSTPAVNPPAAIQAQSHDQPRASSSAADQRRSATVQGPPDRLLVTCIRATPDSRRF